MTTGGHTLKNAIIIGLLLVIAIRNKSTGRSGVSHGTNVHFTVPEHTLISTDMHRKNISQTHSTAFIMPKYVLYMNFYEASYFDTNHTLQLCTHLSIDRLSLLDLLMTTWNGMSY